ncbi:MAG: bifunctional phosphopantothenoylcysteine decarboxylase/phosphopantothenate--cysteine ligase CoaBC, partial [Bdellovibrionales bacterium]|nr:bifunctional phosphopantothenoylcysteine decarboxylase/phosphopantothenate--cysteine ligase CoaBC [Bdellovibrionales bacterium]
MNILLGVSGSIAAYKSCQLVRLLQKQGHHVRVILSPNATKFVTALSFEALTQQKVYQDMFGGNSFATEHIEIARWADLFLIAPASAQTIFGLAHGQADSLLLTVALAFEGPMMIAPAMNTKMWFAPALQSNLQLLKNRNVQVIEPRDGELACKEMGTGAMAEPDEILETVGAHFGKSRLKDKKIVITAGATREYLDPVRFLSNPSTGAMGIALAKRAHERGAEVILVHGPTQLSIPERISSVSVTSAQQMYDYVMSQTPSDVFISSAAVAD